MFLFDACIIKLRRAFFVFYFFRHAGTEMVTETTYVIISGHNLTEGLFFVIFKFCVQVPFIFIY